MKGVNTVLNSVHNLVESFLTTLPQILIAILVIFATWLIVQILNKAWHKIASRLNIRANLEELFRKFIFMTVWIVGILIAAMTVFPDFTPSKLITVIGLGSIAIGFALKDIFENFLAGILILIRQPFQINDYIECESIEGQVREITIRDTRVRRTDGQLVVLPNAMLFQNPVYVLTDQKIRRVTVICGVAYGEDVDKSRDVIRKAVESLETVEKNKPVEIFAREFNSSSIDFEVTWWTGSKPIEVRTSRDKVVAAVKRALDDAGIEIPFPYRTLTFKESLNTIVKNSNGQDAETNQ